MDSEKTKKDMQVVISLIVLMPIMTILVIILFGAKIVKDNDKEEREIMRTRDKILEWEEKNKIYVTIGTVKIIKNNPIIFSFTIKEIPNLTFETKNKDFLSESIGIDRKVLLNYCASYNSNDLECYEMNLLSQKEYKNLCITGIESETFYKAFLKKETDKSKCITIPKTLLSSRRLEHK